MPDATPHLAEAPFLAVRNLLVRFRLRQGIGAALSKGPTYLKASMA